MRTRGHQGGVIAGHAAGGGAMGAPHFCLFFHHRILPHLRSDWAAHASEAIPLIRFTESSWVGRLDCTIIGQNGRIRP